MQKIVMITLSLLLIGCVSSNQNVQNYSLNGSWKISSTEQNGKLAQDKSMDELIFNFDGSSLDITIENKSLLKTLKVGTISYSISGSRLILKSSTGEKVVSRIEFLNQTSFRVSHFGTTQKAELIIISMANAMAGIPMGIGTDVSSSNDWKKDSKVYFSKI